jgi:putative endonuclease
MKNTLSGLGTQGEQFVATWLKEKGFSIVAQNYATKQGEIDVIASKGDLIAFVEVKTRHEKYFALSQVITPAKQRKIIQTARHFMAMRGYNHTKVGRFDVALVEWNTFGEQPSLEYIENAFQATSW